MKNQTVYYVDGITLTGNGVLTVIDKVASADILNNSYDIGMGMGMDVGMDVGMPEEGGNKDPLLSSWIFVIGISLATLAIGFTLGLILAKRKIKKGFELYED